MQEEKNNQQIKCELCSMVANHTETDKDSIIHYFCEHHSLRDKPRKTLQTNTQNNTQNNFLKLLPLFYVFVAIFILSLIRQFLFGPNFMIWMMDFMGIFFIVFGLFKLYDLKGFVVGFQTYDLIAKRIPDFGYIFPFIEIGLGIMYLLGFMFLWQLIITLVISGLGIVSAYIVLKNNSEIQCVCLGTIFNLPMTNVTLLENAFMFTMTFFMFLM